MKQPKALFLQKIWNGFGEEDGNDYLCGRIAMMPD
jgi:hypothetical protein